jgi:hypothetical protein
VKPVAEGGQGTVVNPGKGGRENGASAAGPASDPATALGRIQEAVRAMAAAREATDTAEQVRRAAAREAAAREAAAQGAASRGASARAGAAGSARTGPTPTAASGLQETAPGGVGAAGAASLAARAGGEGQRAGSAEGGDPAGGDAARAGVTLKDEKLADAPGKVSVRDAVARGAAEGAAVPGFREAVETYRKVSAEDVARAGLAPAVRAMVEAYYERIQER